MSIGLKTGEGKAKSKRHTAKGENGNQRGEKWASTDAFRLPLFPLTSVNKKKERNDDKKKEKRISRQPSVDIQTLHSRQS